MGLFSPWIRAKALLAPQQQQHKVSAKSRSSLQPMAFASTHITPRGKVSEPVLLATGHLRVDDNQDVHVIILGTAAEVGL